jgi:glycosyltransferase involved in cell wall biosynthesis
MVSDVYFPRINGVSTSIQTFINALQEYNVEVTLVAPDYGTVQRNENFVFRVPGKPVPYDPEDRVMHWGRLNKQLELLSDISFDAVHIQTPFLAHYAGTKFARKHQLPCIETYHTFFEEYFHHYVKYLPRSLLRLLVREFTRRQAKAVHRLLVPSTIMKSRLRDYGVKTDMQVLPTGLDMDRFSPKESTGSTNRYNPCRTRPTVIHVGRMALEKNLDFLLRAMVNVKKHVPDVLLAIAGEGPALPSLRSRAANLGLSSNIRFLGNLGRDGDLQEFYRSGDVFAFASKTETQGLVLLESMACGTPVVSLAFMGTCDILDPGRGALVSAEDEEDFSNKLVCVLTATNFRHQLGKEARAYAEEWSANRFAARLADVYWEISHKEDRRPSKQAAAVAAAGGHPQSDPGLP